MYVNLRYFPVVGKLIIKQLICSLCSILFIMIFPAMIDSGIGEVLFSFLSIIVYFDLMYTTTWSIASKHRRDVNIYNRKQQSSEQIKYNKWFGIYISLFYFLINLVLAVICILMDIYGTPPVSVTANFVFKLWFLEFISLFLRVVRYKYILWILISIFSAIPVLLGFFSGLADKNRFDVFVKKLVYKDKK